MPAKPVNKKTATRKTKTRRATRTAKSALPASPISKSDRMGVFLRAISERFPDDPSCPGLVISYVGNATSGGWNLFRPYYASIVRYAKGGGHGKYVVVSAQGASVLETLNSLRREWDRHVCATQCPFRANL